MPFLLTSEHIKNQFIVNPDWKNIFLKYYPEWKTETYVRDSLEVWKKNGWTMQIDKRGSKNSESNMYHVIYVGVYHEGDWQYELMMNDYEWERHMLVDAICDYEIDFSTFK